MFYYTINYNKKSCEKNKTIIIILILFFNTIKNIKERK